MRSKNNKKKPASKHQGKLAKYFRRITLIGMIAIIAAGAVAGTYYLAQAFYVREIRVSGNNHLDKRDIEGMLNIRREPLLNLRMKDIETKLRSNAWIRNVSLRWQLPGTMIINITESNPRALLSYRGKMFLVNEEGNIMEEIEEQVTPFLPVISGIDPRYKKVMSEVMILVEVMAAKNIIAEKQYIEIGLQSYGFTANIDGEFIKVGYGQYGEKFDRWVELEPELKKRGVPIEYIDLRFKDSVIVKPVKEEKGKKKDPEIYKDKDKEKIKNEKKI